jgi:hypothetical protein
LAVTMAVGTGTGPLPPYGRIGAKHTLALALLVILVTIGLVVFALPSLSGDHSSRGNGTSGFRTTEFARVYPYLAYDEQVGVTFTQDFSSFSFNVTAVAQTGPDGAGPAYLLSGLTNVGYWYQVGLSYRWPGSSGGAPGFSMNYEVFDPYGNSIYPYSGGGGIDSIPVISGDQVQLALNFTGTNVVMEAMDWNTTSMATETFNSFGASYFVGLPGAVSQNGFFTGLMTEEYHSSPYTGTGQPVVYRESGFNFSSEWMWLDEFNTNTNQLVFADQTSSPISFNNSTLLNYFSSNGTAAASSDQEFVTGLTPVTFPTLISSALSTLQPGQQASLNLRIINPSKLLIMITSLTISSQFGTYNSTSSVPSTLGANSTFITTITIPSNVPNGTYTMNIVADFEFSDPQLSAWMIAEPLQTTTLIVVTGSSVPPPTNPPPTTNPPPITNPTPKTNPTVASRLFIVIGEFLLPAFLAYAAAAILVAVLLVVRQERAVSVDPVLVSPVCGNCGGIITEGMRFCPTCGASLVQTLGQTSSEVKNSSEGPPSC